MACIVLNVSVENTRGAMMSDLQHFCLRWNNYQSSITSAFENLRDDEDFIDVTLACDGKSLKAHRVVLSACSPYFRELLKVSVMMMIMNFKFAQIDVPTQYVAAGCRIIDNGIIFIVQKYPLHKCGVL